jgi:hypothetical protein
MMYTHYSVCCHSEERRLALCMGMHARLGAQSLILSYLKEPGLLEQICEQREPVPLAVKHNCHIFFNYTLYRNWLHHMWPDLVRIRSNVIFNGPSHHTFCIRLGERVIEGVIPRDAPDGESGKIGCCFLTQQGGLVVYLSLLRRRITLQVFTFSHAHGFRERLHKVFFGGPRHLVLPWFQLEMGKQNKKKHAA